MIPEDIVPADSGEVVLLKLSFQKALGSDEEGQSAVCYCVLKRPGGFLLAVPSGFLSAGALQEASDLGFPGLIGPFTPAYAPAVELSESGEWIGVYPPRTIELTLVDFADGAAAGLEPLEEGLAACVPFVPEGSMLFPLAASLTAFAAEWTSTMEGERGAGYVTAEELIPEVPPLLERRQKAAPAAKKPTVAQLANQQGEIVQALQALSTQVQALASANRPSAAEPPQGPHPKEVPEGPRPALTAPVSTAISAPALAPRNLAAILGAPPKARPAGEARLQVAEEAHLALADIDGEPLQAENQIASAFLAQSRALTALVSQLSSGGDPLSDLSSASSSSLSIKGSAARLKLQRELLSRSGVFFQKVQEAAVRRMEPTANLGAVQEASQRSVMTRFLERYGAFKDQRVWGLVQWQLAQIFDLLASEQVEGAKDVLALLMLMVDQTVLDSGHHELGWILSLQEDPPSQVFTAPQHSSSSSVRPCSHLCDPKWLAVALSYVKEMETLSSRRSEVAKGKAGGYGSEAVPKTAAPPLSRKQQRAKLWAERKASAQPKG